jgi:uncharacterized glyoxalase superfamily protein PhnB
MTTPKADPAQPRTVSSEVTVGVDPSTAFSVFTDEMDLWWVRGPINFYDAARAIGMRCEPGVGGRLLELYSEDGSDALELGRITLWRPGDVLAWDSSVDDVATEVRFEPVAGGTRVTVTATIPPGGADRGGTSWVRVVPGWFGAWTAQRDTASRHPAETGRLALALYYEKPVQAARWLADAFGFAVDLELSGDDGHSWIEFRVGNSSIMLFEREGDGPKGESVTHVPWVYVDDLDGHLQNARDHGATIISGIRQHGYRAYEAADVDGYRWTFVQARPTM